MSMRERLGVHAAAIAVLVLLPQTMVAQNKQLTIDELYDPAKKLDFGKAPSSRDENYSWVNNAEFVRKDDDGRYYRVQATSGTESLLFDPAQLEQVLAQIPGV